jgi:uncharacterized membrane protein YdjX (TVP38/TMEM64 family)
VAAVVVGTVVAAALLLPVRDMIIGLAASARGWGISGVVVFFAAYVISTVAFLPGSLLTLAAGFVYGPVWGLAIASPASVAGAASAFVLGRTFLREWASRTVGASARTRAIDAAIEREGFKLVLLLRLSPVFPFNVLNYLLSLTRVRFGTFVLASFFGMLPGTAMYVYLGSLAPAAAQLGPSGAAGGTATTLLYGAGLVATVAVVVTGTRLARRALAAEIGDTAA